MSPCNAHKMKQWQVVKNMIYKQIKIQNVSSNRTFRQFFAYYAEYHALYFIQYTQLTICIC